MPLFKQLLRKEDVQISRSGISEHKNCLTTLSITTAGPKEYSVIG
jgi:hypothetical protein